MKKIYLIGICVLATATADAQFNGSFSPSEWVTSASGSSLTANIDTLMAPDSLFINGPNDETGLTGSLSYSVIIPTNGSLTFGYRVTSQDTGAVADPNEYISWKVNSDTLGIVKDSTTGMTTFVLMAGDTFTFTVNSSLNENGIIQAKIYDWTFTQTPLSITGGNLGATVANNNINLQWNTYSETNNKGFEIQRSEDGKIFTTLSFIKSKGENGNSTGELAYYYTDSTPASETGELLYRYRQIDFDNKAVYSNIVRVQVGLLVGSNMVVYPNPAGISACITLDNKEPGTIYVFDFQGRQVTYSKTNGPLARINIENLLPGAFILNFIGVNGLSHFARFTVQ